MEERLYNWHELTVIRNFFTEDQWNAIECALGDYQDYGDEESDLSDQVLNKIHELFLT